MTSSLTGGERVAVAVAHLGKEVGADGDLGGLAALHLVEVEVVGDNVRQRLRVRRRAAAADVDVVGDLGQLVGDAVGDVGARGGARVGAHHHAPVELHGHDRGAGAHLGSGVRAEVQLAGQRLREMGLAASDAGDHLLAVAHDAGRHLRVMIVFELVVVIG